MATKLNLINKLINTWLIHRKRLTNYLQNNLKVYQKLILWIRGYNVRYKSTIK